MSRQHLVALTTSFALLATAAAPTAFGAAPAHSAVSQETFPDTSKMGFVPITPIRIVDTTIGRGLTSQLKARKSSTIDLSTLNGIPTHGAHAVSLTVTAVTPTRDGFITVTPAASQSKRFSTLNFTKGQDASNNTFIGLDHGNKVNITSSSDTHVLIEVNGYFPTTEDFRAVPPQRLIDTRDGGAGGRLKGGERRTIAVAGHAGIPKNGVEGVVLHLTTARPSNDGWAVVYTHGNSRPHVAHMGYAKNQNRTAMVIVKPDTEGKIDLYTMAEADFIVDVAGYIPKGSHFHVVTPERLVDTRSSAVLTGPLAANSEHTLKVTGRAGVPDGARGAILNVTSADAAEKGHMSLYSPNIGQPHTRTLTFPKRLAFSNTGLTDLSDDGYVTLHTSAESHAVLDVVGYFTW